VRSFLVCDRIQNFDGPWQFSHEIPFSARAKGPSRAAFTVCIGAWHSVQRTVSCARPAPIAAAMRAERSVASVAHDLACAARVCQIVKALRSPTTTVLVVIGLGPAPWQIDELQPTAPMKSARSTLRNVFAVTMAGVGPGSGSADCAQAAGTREIIRV